MKKLLAVAMVVGMAAASVFGSSGVGVFGTYMDGEDVKTGYGGGLKFKADFAEILAMEFRISGITKFDDWLEEDDLYVIPLEIDLLLNLPLGDSPVTLYAGGGGGYYIIPEYEDSVVLDNIDVDLEDSFGFFGVGGLEIALGESVSLFVEGKYLLLTVDEAKIDDEDVKYDGDEEIDFSGINVNAGFLFHF